MLQRAAEKGGDQILVGSPVKLVGKVPQRCAGFQRMAVRAGDPGEQFSRFQPVGVGDRAQVIGNEGMQFEQALFRDQIHLARDALARHVAGDDLVGVDVLTRHIGFAHAFAHPFLRPHAHHRHEGEHPDRQRPTDPGRLDPGEDQVDRGRDEDGDHALRIDRQQMHVEHHAGVVGQGLQVVQKHHDRKETGHQADGREEAHHAATQFQVLHPAGDHQADDRRHHEHRSGANAQVGEEVQVVERIVGGAGLIPGIAARPHHERQDADDEQHRRPRGQRERPRQFQVRAGVDFADEIHQGVDADHFHGEVNPLGRPHPDEVVDQAADAARTRHRDGIPDTGAGDRADDVGKDQKEHPVALDEIHQLGLVFAVGFRFQQGEQKRGAHRRVGRHDVNRADNSHDPGRTDLGHIKCRIHAEHFHAVSP